jgi:predicted NBD/HSP70 family sugar kinase
MRQFLVYDLGGTYIKFALMNENFEILSQDKVPSPTDSMENLLAAMKGIADRYEGQYEAAAVSMPGRINTYEGIAYTGGAYAFIKDTPFAKLLSDTIGCRAVIGNDGKCAAKAEAARGALKDTKNGAVIVLGSGTGGGIVLNHDVWMGTTGGAGELSALVADLRAIAKDGYSFYNFGSVYAGYGSATGLISLYAAKKGIPIQEAFGKITGMTFFEAYDAGEKEAVETLEEYGLNAAVGINSVQCVLDLERYAIGGGISARKEVTDSIRKGIEKLFDHAGFPLPFSKPEIVTCQFRNDANLIGALAFLLDAE